MNPIDFYTTNPVMKLKEIDIVMGTGTRGTYAQLNMPVSIQEKIRLYPVEKEKE